MHSPIDRNRLLMRALRSPQERLRRLHDMTDNTSLRPDNASAERGTNALQGGRRGAWHEIGSLIPLSRHKCRHGG
jgi:hypothetical protein